MSEDDEALARELFGECVHGPCFHLRERAAERIRKLSGLHVIKLERDLARVTEERDELREKVEIAKRDLLRIARAALRGEEE